MPRETAAERPAPLFIDTGAWYAYFNKDDPDHVQVQEVMDAWNGVWLTTNHVFDEVVTLVGRRVSHRAAVKAGKALRDKEVARLEWVSQKDEAEAWRLYVARTDKRYSVTDCTSFVIMKRLGLTSAAATDDDFAREGFRRLP